MTVAQEMLELAEKMRRSRKVGTEVGFLMVRMLMSPSELELAEIALRESALSRNEVVTERMI